MKLSIIVTDSGPLITLAVAHALDALLLPGLPVIIPDMVRFEVIQDLDKPGASEVANWIRSNEPQRVRIASTEVFEEFELLRRVSVATRTKDRGEQAAAEVLSRELEDREFGAILIFEDSMVRKQNFLIRLPDEVVVTSTSEFLFGLERHGLLPSADEVLARAVALRGKEVLNRRLGGSTIDAPIQDWPSRMAPARR
jgi:hypothetical protein